MHFPLAILTKNKKKWLIKHIFGGQKVETDVNIEDVVFYPDSDEFTYIVKKREIKDVYFVSVPEVL